MRRAGPACCCPPTPDVRAPSPSLTYDACTTHTGVGELLRSDPHGRTAAGGVWAAGNVTDPAAQVVQAMAAGVTAAIDINAELVNGEIELALRRSAPAA